MQKLNDGRAEKISPVLIFGGKMNSKGHLYISLMKSFLRILACFLLVFANVNQPFFAFAVLFGVAEIGGVLEEVFDKR